LSTRSLLREAIERIGRVRDHDISPLRNIAASFQFNLARGIAGIAINAAVEHDIPLIALSGGVAYNRAIRETIRDQVTASGFEFCMNAEYPLGDGCISYGQCIFAGITVIDE